ncbi:CDCA8 [Branchiostoma lanceolatum]|uniref:CDCA8 protein n=2 Tax=Branchiostoma lanceolatum TaxID=7740 RepID=A0A8K0EWN8_BRALA|nr:CDCA8 [Branchiostoma lanceolatum]
MPKKRKTRQTTRAKPKLPEGDEGHDMDQEERERKKELFLQDFDVEAESKIKQSNELGEKICNLGRQQFRLEVMKLPKKIQNMTMAEFLAQGGSIEAIQLQSVTDTDAKECTSAEKTRMPLAAVSNNIAATETVEEDEKESKPKGRPPKRKTTKKKDSAPPPTKRMTRSSARTQGGTASRLGSKTSRNALTTPAVKGSKPVWSDTPLITPKFDPRLPTTPMVREAKAGERLMSISGSPVLNRPMAAAVRVPEALIPVGDGKVFQCSHDVDPDDVEIPDMDEKTISNIQLLQQKLAAILKKARQNQTTSQSSSTESD